MTPKSYLSFINGYKTIYSEKRGEIGNLAHRMNTGLTKLMEASDSVAVLSRELAVKEKELAVASEKAEKVSPLKSINCKISKEQLVLMFNIFCYRVSPRIIGTRFGAVQKLLGNMESPFKISHYG